MKQFIEDMGLASVIWAFCMGAFVLLCVGVIFAAPAGAQDGQLNLDLQTGPNAYAKGSGKVTIRVPTEHEIGEALRYPGVDGNNFRARVAQWARCRNPGASVYDGRPQEFYALDVSDVKQTLSVREARVLRSDENPGKQIGAEETCDATQSASELTCSVNLHRTVTDTATRSAQNTYSGTVSVKVGMRFGTFAQPVGATVDTTLSATVGYATTNGWSHTDTVGWDLGATTTVPAGQVRKLKVVAREEQASFRIDYQTAIEGTVKMRCYDDTPWQSVTVENLYNGSLVPYPGNQVSVQPMPTSDLDYSETINLSLFANATVVQTDQ